MRNIKNLQQATVALEVYISKKPATRKYNLVRMITLMNYLGNPQNDLKIIHVAGTSGKTSTAYYTASLLKAAGYTTGLTVSPHVTAINERAQINVKQLPVGEYCRQLNQFLNLVDTSGLKPTYFEILIAFAFWLFQKNHVDYAIIEVGIGGLLDSTNIITKTDKVCVITDIGFDHLKILGNTVSQITRQKAGIIQRQNQVFIYDQSSEITSVVKRRCQLKDASLHIVDAQSNSKLDKLNLPLFQKRNLNLAINVVNHVLKRDHNQELKPSQITKAAQVQVPARMEIIDHNQQLIVLDGSHNTQKISALVASMQQRFDQQPITLIVGFGNSEKDGLDAKMKLLRQLGSKIILTSFDDRRRQVKISVSPTDLAIYAKEAGFEDISTTTDPFQALQLLKQNPSNVGLITGSFFLASRLRPAVLSKI